MDMDPESSAEFRRRRELPNRSGLRRRPDLTLCADNRPLVIEELLADIDELLAQIEAHHGDKDAGITP
jgi:hypothetical protein